MASVDGEQRVHVFVGHRIGSAVGVDDDVRTVERDLREFGHGTDAERVGGESVDGGRRGPAVEQPTPAEAAPHGLRERGDPRLHLSRDP
jgi:hypothetical protein